MDIKEKAVELMKKLDIYKPYVNDFKRSPQDKVCIFEQFAGFYVYQYEEVIEKMIDIEERYDVKVYAITHEYTEFGELYDFLFVEDTDDFESTISNADGRDTFYAYAYVWNKYDEWCSEFGRVMIASKFGGLMRIA